MKIILCILSMGLAIQANAMTFEREVEFAEVATKSSSVLLGEVLSVTVVEEGGRLHSRYRVQTTRALRGGAASELDVTLPGGKADGVVEWVPGVPSWEVGTEVVICVDADGHVPLRGVFTVRDSVLDSIGGIRSPPRSVGEVQQRLRRLALPEPAGLPPTFVDEGE